MSRSLFSINIRGYEFVLNASQIYEKQLTNTILR